VATVVSSVAPVASTTTLASAIEAALELATDEMPQTPEGVPEDVLEEPQEEPEMFLELVPKGVTVEGVMIITHVVAPSLPHDATEVPSLTCRTAAAADATISFVGELEVVMGHPTFHALDDIP
jgi:hypothetical protein